MPELPEVETIRRGLEQTIVGRTIEGVEVFDDYMLDMPKEEFQRRLKGRRVEGVERKGKYLIWKLDGGEELVIHLRMTGQLTFVEKDYKRLTFHIGGKDLHYCDLRRMGEMRLVKAGDYKGLEGLANIGPEPLSENFTLPYFYSVLRGKKGKIKALLMDQSLLAGVGNIYANEALFEAGIHPERSANTLTPQEVERLYHAIRKVLMEALQAGGETFSNYVNIWGEAGLYQPRVYQREGERCIRCGETIITIKIGGRTSYLCPQCQK